MSFECQIQMKLIVRTLICGLTSFWLDFILIAEYIFFLYSVVICCYRIIRETNPESRLFARTFKSCESMFLSFIVSENGVIRSPFEQGVLVGQVCRDPPDTP